MGRSPSPRSASKSGSAKHDMQLLHEIKYHGHTQLKWCTNYFHACCMLYDRRTGRLTTTSRLHAKRARGALDFSSSFPVVFAIVQSANLGIPSPGLWSRLYMMSSLGSEGACEGTNCPGTHDWRKQATASQDLSSINLTSLFPLLLEGKVTKCSCHCV